jgi:hypothetical protein
VDPGGRGSEGGGGMVEGGGVGRLWRAVGSDVWKKAGGAGGSRRAASSEGRGGMVEGDGERRAARADGGGRQAGKQAGGW